MTPQQILKKYTTKDYFIKTVNLEQAMTEYHELQSAKDKERIEELEAKLYQLEDLKSMNEELNKEVERLRGLDTKIHLDLIRENEELEAEVERLRARVFQMENPLNPQK